MIKKQLVNIFLQYGAKEGRVDTPIKKANETGGSEGGTGGTTPVKGGTTPVNGETGGTTPVKDGTDGESKPPTQADIDAMQSKQIEDLMNSDVDATQSKQIEDLYKMYNESKKTDTTTTTTTTKTEKRSIQNFHARGKSIQK